MQNTRTQEHTIRNSSLAPLALINIWYFTPSSVYCAPQTVSEKNKYPYMFLNGKHELIFYIPSDMLHEYLHGFFNSKGSYIDHISDCNS